MTSLVIDWNTSWAAAGGRAAIGAEFERGPGERL